MARPYIILYVYRTLHATSLLGCYCSRFGLRGRIMLRPYFILYVFADAPWRVPTGLCLPDAMRCVPTYYSNKS